MIHYFLNFYKGALTGLFIAFMASCSSVNSGTEDLSQNLIVRDKYLQDISLTISEVESLKKLTDRDSLLQQFKIARIKFKAVEPILAYAQSSAYKALNQPNLIIVHEGSNGIENENPHGFQVLEEALVQDSLDFTFISSEIDNIYNTLTLERDNPAINSIQDYQFLWLVRDEILRVMALGISGFDSPVIQHSLPENKAAMQSLFGYFSLYEDRFNDPKLYSNWLTILKKASNELENDTFDKFDRYHFIRECIHPLLRLWKSTVTDWNITFPFDTKINYEAESFFSDITFNTEKFAPAYAPPPSKEIAALGKLLFTDKNLSAEGNMSCSSCHAENLYFTDGLKKSLGANGKELQRNSPTLLYSGLQNNQFYDARVSNLENQIIAVVSNTSEFHSNLTDIEEHVKSSDVYLEKFNKNYSDGVTERNIRNAIAQYIRSLAPFSSKFDKNIRGDINTLAQSEINGFNLFMGKAGCGTCHFAPVFNGTVPPGFSHTELEVLGVPEKNHNQFAAVDPDSGRYKLHKARLKLYAFKTPTVRNVSKTAPYMHNGVFKNLHEVMDFYNQGGGSGMGIELENQTLPADPLDLTKDEVNDIIMFMNTLEDNQKQLSIADNI